MRDRGLPPLPRPRVLSDEPAAGAEPEPQASPTTKKDTRTIKRMGAGRRCADAYAGARALRAEVQRGPAAQRRALDHYHR